MNRDDGCVVMNKKFGNRRTDEGTAANDGSMNTFHFKVDRAGDQPQVTGRLSKLAQDIQDLWTLDLEVPCFIGQCKQGEVGLLPPAWEHSMFGCDLWVEVQGISQTSP